MAEIADGETVEAQGSGGNVYYLRNVKGVYSCSCPAWTKQRVPLDQRTCKHLRAHLGDARETERVGVAAKRPQPARRPPGVGEDPERRAERREHLRQALEMFPVVADRMIEVYGLRMPKHLAYAAGFWAGLDKEEKSEAWAYLGNGPGCITEWFYEGMLDRKVKPGLDERLADRFRCDPPEMVTVWHGNSDGGHWGLWYDNPEDLPTTVVMNYARDDAETNRCKPTLLATLREDVAGRGEAFDPFEWPLRTDILSWLDECIHGELRAHAEENIPLPVSRADNRVGGFASYVPGFVVPKEEQSYEASTKRYEAYRNRSAVVQDWIDEAMRELEAGRPGKALYLGRELHWVDADEWRADCTKLLVGAYRALGRHALAEIARLHHEHRDLASVDVYEPEQPSELMEHVWKGDVDAIRAALGTSQPKKHELFAALKYPSPEAVALVLERKEAHVFADEAALEHLSSLRDPHPIAELVTRHREALLAIWKTCGAVGKAFNKALTGKDEELKNLALEHANIEWRGENGASVLHIAARVPDLEVVRTLLDRGADPLARDKDGKTPYDAARDGWARDQRVASAIFALLTERGGGPSPAVQKEPTAEWAPGGKVTHSKFGDGTIEAVAGEGADAKLTIKFANATKTLVAKFVTRAIQ